MSTEVNEAVLQHPAMEGVGDGQGVPVEVEGKLRFLEELAAKLERSGEDVEDVQESLQRFRTVTAPQRGLNLGGSVPAMPPIGRHVSASSMPLRAEAQLIDPPVDVNDRRPAPPPSKVGKRAPRQPGARRGTGHLLDYSSPDTQSGGGSSLPEAPTTSRSGKAPRRAETTPAIKGAIGPPATALRSDAQRHAQRMLHKKNRDEMRYKDEDRRRQIARRIYEKEQRAKVKREQEIERKKREDMARLMYEKMCAGLRADEIRRYRTAARNIQRVWRGVMARNMIARWEYSVIKVQSVVRSHQCRVFQKKRRDQIAQSQAEARRFATLNKAALIIQRRARFMFAQKSLNRIKRAKELRRWYSARVIQRGWGVYRRAIERELVRKEEQLRMSELIRQRQLNATARKIQRWWRTSQQRMAIQNARAEMDNQSVAALAIQRLYRGGATRNAMRRIQLLNSATGREKRMDKAIPVIQRGIRCFLARRRALQARELKIYHTHNHELQKAARAVQRAFRCHRSKKMVTGLKCMKMSMDKHASVIQRQYRGHRARRETLQLREQKRLTPAVLILQTAWRSFVERKKEAETAAYHMELKQQSRDAEMRTRAAMRLQAFIRGGIGRKTANERKERQKHLIASVCTMQRAIRCFFACEMLTRLRKLRMIVEEQENLHCDQRKAAILLQRNMRGKLSRLLLSRMAADNRNALVVQGFFMRCKAKQVLTDLKADRDLSIKIRCIIKIQRRVRRWLSTCEMKRLEAYYNGKRREKLLESRRAESVLTIQCAWRASKARTCATRLRLDHARKTKPAITIQRCWRARTFRREIEAEVEARVIAGLRKNDAALKIQAFWRMVCAQEYTQMLREDREIETDAVMHMQCWWRQMRAMQVVRERRALKEATVLKARHEAEMFEHCLSLTQAAARCVIAQLHRNRLIVAHVEKEIESQKTYAISIQYGAAVSIQAVYRGYSDRLYAKGLRREKREREERIARELRERSEAALVVQLFIRRCFAQQRVSTLRKEKATRVSKEIDEYEICEQPSELIRQLFWEMEAARGVAIVRESASKKKRREVAARCIQCMIRKTKAMRKTRLLREQRRRGCAVLVIQRAWESKKHSLDEIKTAERTTAATKIQSLQRGRMGRAAAARNRAQHEADVAKCLELEIAMDSAVVLIQSFWRLVIARRLARGIAQDMHKKEVVARSHEGATFIQKVYRGYRGRLVSRKSRAAEATREKEEHNRKVCASERKWSFFLYCQRHFWGSQN